MSEIKRDGEARFTPSHVSLNADGTFGLGGLVKTEPRRRVEVETDDGWSTLPGGLENIRDGMRFRMFEPDGTPAHGGEVCTARGASFPVQSGWGVEAEPCPSP